MTTSQNTKKIAAIISRPGRAAVADILPDLFAWLDEHGYRIVIDQETATYNSGREVVPRAQMGSRALDLVVVLGGDGTLLRLPALPPLSTFRCSG